MKKTFKFGMLAILMVSILMMAGCPQKPSPQEPQGPEVEKFTVTITQPENGGAITVSPELPADKKVAKDTELTFTATVATGYTFKNWDITGSTITEADKTKTTVKVKITKATTVKVVFEKSFAKIAFSELPNYLANTASETEVNYIEVTGLTAENLGPSFTAGTLGNIIKTNSTKKVAVTLPTEIASLTSMKNSFASCTNLISVSNIPSTVTDMFGCFSKCSNLEKTPEIPASVTDMKMAFAMCTKLTQAPTFAVGSTLENIEGCFIKCTSLQKAPQIPASVTTMKNCFSGCTSLTESPTFEGSPVVTNMEQSFTGCTSLEVAPEIPASVTSMRMCFKNCSALITAPTFAIGAKVTDITSAFDGCVKLVTAPSIPDTVTDMDACFNGCTELTTVELPTQVTTLKGTFSGCTSLVNAPAIPASATAFCRIFQNCSGITGVTLNCAYPSACAENTFEGCTALTASSIKVPSAELDTYKTNATTMGTTADKFSAIDGGTISFRTVNFADLETYLTNATETEVSIKVTGLTNDNLGGAGNSGTLGYIIKNSDKIINLSLEVESGVDTLGSWVFSGCTKLKSLIIPGAITKIEGDQIFENCNALIKVTLEEGVEEIGAGIFEKHDKLSIKLPSTITSIGSKAFGNPPPTWNPTAKDTRVKEILVPASTSSVKQLVIDSGYPDENNKIIEY